MISAVLIVVGLVGFVISAWYLRDLLDDLGGTADATGVSARRQPRHRAPD